MIKHLSFRACALACANCFVLAALLLVAGLVLSPMALAQEVATSASPFSGGLPATGSLFQSLLTPAAIGYAVALVTTVLPKPSGPGLYAFVRGLLDLIGANFGNSRNTP